MKNLRLVEQYRARALEAEMIRQGVYDADAGDGGVFCVLSPIDKAKMVIVASFGDGWDHVSVSRKNRPPNWTEMDYVKRLFFHDHETAMQLHVAVSDHINVAPTCLHLWRPQNKEIPRPPGWMVGPSELSDVRPVDGDADGPAG